MTSHDDPASTNFVLGESNGPGRKGHNKATTAHVRCHVGWRRGDSQRTRRSMATLRRARGIVRGPHGGRSLRRGSRSVADREQRRVGFQPAVRQYGYAGERAVRIVLFPPGSTGRSPPPPCG